MQNFEFHKNHYKRNMKKILASHEKYRAFHETLRTQIDFERVTSDPDSFDAMLKSEREYSDVIYNSYKNIPNTIMYCIPFFLLINIVGLNLFVSLGISLVALIYLLILKRKYDTICFNRQFIHLLCRVAEIK